MENRAHALAAGLFTLALLVALVAAALWFRRDDIRFAEYLLTTSGSVTGLKVEAPVRFRGVDVGRVESIHLEPGGSGRVNVRIGVSEDTPVTRGTYAQLGYQGVTGLAFVSLDDDGSSSERLKSEGRGPPRIELRPSIFDSGMDLVASVKDLSARLSELLNEDNRKLFARSLAAFEQVSRQTAALAGKLQAGAGDLPALAGDARTALADISRLAHTLEQRSAAFDRMADSMDEVGTAARSFGDETVPRINVLVEELQRDTRTLSRVLNALNDNPQAFIFGAQRSKPGPGESGFKDGTR